MKFWNWLKDKLFQLYHRARNSPGTPHEIAFAFAVGLFAGCMPLPAAHLIVAILFALILRVRKIPALAGAIVILPIFWPPLFSFEYLLGRAIWNLMPGVLEQVEEDTPLVEVALQNPGLWGRFKEYSTQLLIGWVITGLVVALIGYFIIKPLIARYQAARLAKKTSV